jgi:mono/diheme cytochrome c family protein
MTITRRGGALASLTLALALLVAGPAGAGSSAKPAPAPAAAADPVPQLLRSPADVARGKSLFAGTCGAYCHKMTNAPADAPFLFDCDWLFGGSDEQIFHTITHGVPNSRMVPFGGAIPDQDIWRIVAYLRSASQCRK